MNALANLLILAAVAMWTDGDWVRIGHAAVCLLFVDLFVEIVTFAVRNDL